MDKKQLSKKLSFSLKKIGLKNGDTLYVSGNLINFYTDDYKKSLLLPKIFFNEIFKIIGKDGTIAFPAHNFNLVNSTRIFDPKKTLSISGSFSNYIIKHKKFERQVHPFASIGAIGGKAKYICKTFKRSVYGKSTPFDKLIKLNCKFLSLGMPINLNCSQVHHIEYLNKVPYRYNKYFYHKIKIKNQIKNIRFSLFVIKKKFLNIKRNNNKIIINNFLKKTKIKKTKFLKSNLYLYNLNEFYLITLKLFKKNIFSWIGKNLNKNK